jgi:hypothetical protein
MRKETKIIILFKFFEIGLAYREVIFGHEQVNDIKISSINDSDKAAV